ncbi:MAG: DNA-binding protein [Candidatus Viridilinea halotolerans]|uniref:DNA-binding protein n=1 Tax=Candidatus Viridilinea halotolerans TaxID=2491704 RepID=A0A426U0Y4_9CHLR|nr:MAG: DNA-binding protein [Candidatus Viridilinea halotolerans]
MAEAQPLGSILTVDEVADYLRVSRATVCRWCASGKLPAFKIGKGWRVRHGELEGFIRQQRGGDRHESALKPTNLGQLAHDRAPIALHAGNGTEPT